MDNVFIELLRLYTAIKISCLYNAMSSLLFAHTYNRPATVSSVKPRQGNTNKDRVQINHNALKMIPCTDKPDTVKPDDQTHNTSYVQNAEHTAYHLRWSTNHCTVEETRTWQYCKCARTYGRFTLSHALHNSHRGNGQQCILNTRFHTHHTNYASPLPVLCASVLALVEITRVLKTDSNRQW